MNTASPTSQSPFTRAIAIVAMSAPILLVFAAGTLPEGLARGDLIVKGHEVLLALLSGAVLLRAAYALGRRQASAPRSPVARLEHVTA